MMSSGEQQRFDDQVLIRYLLGSLPEEEAERLDELSIADDAFAWRLNSVENDIVDAYVRDELSGDHLALFKKFYLSSPRRLQKVEFAGALYSFGARTVTATDRAAQAGTVPSANPKEESSKDLSPWRWPSVPRSPIQWGFAGGALAIVLLAGYLLLENTQLRRQTAVAQGSQAGADYRERELERQLKEQQGAIAQMSKELDSLRRSQQSSDQPQTLSAILLPPTRGVSPVPTLSLPSGTSLVVLLLTLESDDFPAYRVRLRDSVTNQSLWHSANLGATPGGANKIVSLSFPARLLKPQNYILELSGVSSSGRPEFIGGYPIRVVIR
jgi:hypothetical protein